MSRGLIILDPGHGKTGNAHTTRAGYYEGTQNFVLSQFLRDAKILLSADSTSMPRTETLGINILLFPSRAQSA